MRENIFTRFYKNIRSLLGFYSKERKIKDLQGTTHELEHIYKDKLGNNWYKLKNFPVLPAMRLLAATPLLDSLALGITPDTQIKYMDEMINNSFNMKPNEFKQYIVRTASNIKERQTLIVEPEIFKGLIKYYLFIDGEGEEMEDKFINEKLKAIEKDKEAFFFFIALLYNSINKQANISPKDIKSYLQKEEVIRILENR